MTFFNIEDAIDFVPERRRKNAKYPCHTCKELALTIDEFRNHDSCAACSDDNDHQDEHDY